ncbi:MAG: serine/threonine protein kinase [Planctomycetes bacterium]|nr:serine/threonine protein kinase [Planctomycetota bacterium]
MKERVGRGSFGTVYRALWEGREVAVKELHPWVRQDAGRLDALRQEVDLLRSLDHERVVRVLAYDGENGRVVMEFVRGKTFRALLDDPGSRLSALLASLQDVAQGLMFLHSRRLVHKDVKPENIFVSESGGAKLGDFGFAQRTGGLGGWLRRLAGRQRIQGTVAYMAPEILKGGSPSGKSDAFSLGVVIYEAAALRRPFRSSSEQISKVEGGAEVSRGAGEVVRKILKHDPEPPSRARPGVPREIDAVALGLLAKDPSERLEVTHAFMALRTAVAKIQARRSEA